VRVFGTFENPLFVAADVCACLGLTNISLALSRVDPDDVCSINVTDSVGRERSTRVVNESGLYELIIGSRKKDALAFKRWITKEVLPAIRKTGRYDIEEQMRNLVFDRFLTIVPQEYKTRFPASLFRSFLGVHGY
jgi:prophage antirepressor-like protein